MNPRPFFFPLFSLLASLPVLADLNCPTVDFTGVQAQGLNVHVGGQNDQSLDAAGSVNIRVLLPDGSVEFFDDPANTVIRESTITADRSLIYSALRRTPSGGLIFRTWTRVPGVSTTPPFSFGSEDYFGANPPSPGSYVVTTNTSLSFNNYSAQAYVLIPGPPVSADACAQFVDNGNGVFLLYGLLLQGTALVPIHSTFLIGGGTKSLSVSGGDGQVGVVGMPLASPLIVATTDQAGAPVGGLDVSFSISSFPVNTFSIPPTPSTGMALAPDHGTTDTSTGLLSTSFTLGDLPAGYEVTATCPSCAAGQSTAAFHVCGKLPSAEYKQYASPSSPWGTIPYDNECLDTQKNTIIDCAPRGMGINVSSYTIQSKGCALSAMASLINFYARVFSGKGIPVMDPGQLNVVLGSAAVNGFDRDHNVRWEKIAHPQVSNGRIQLFKELTGGDNPQSEQGLLNIADSELLNKSPVIFEVVETKVLSRPGQPDQTTQNTHFILALGKCGNYYLVSNPGWPGTDRYDPSVQNKVAGPFTVGGVTTTTYIGSTVGIFLFRIQ